MALTSRPPRRLAGTVTLKPSVRSVTVTLRRPAS